MLQETKSIYNFKQEAFEYNGQRYHAVLTPELYAEEDGLDFTGNYIGMLIHPMRGTISFQLTPNEETKWEMEFLDTYNPGLLEDLEILENDQTDKIIPGLNDPGIIDELDTIIQKFLKGE